MLEERLLEGSLPVDRECALDAKEPVGVLECATDLVLGRAAHTEVDEGGDGDHPDLPSGGAGGERGALIDHGSSLAQATCLGHPAGPRARFGQLRTALAPRYAGISARSAFAGMRRATPDRWADAATAFATAGATRRSNTLGTM